jgi:predicted small lipoprotein YifL
MGLNNSIVGTVQYRATHKGAIVISLVMAFMALSACGQRGSLYLPTEPAARNRATLPQVLLPLPRSAAPDASAAPTTPSTTDSTPANPSTTLPAAR